MGAQVETHRSHARLRQAARTIRGVFVAGAFAIGAGGCGKRNSPRDLEGGVSAESRTFAREIFALRCAACHGNDGSGSPLARSSDTAHRPRDFRSHDWQAETSDEAIAHIVIRGGAAMGKSIQMPANPDLEYQPEVVRALIERLRQFGSP